MSKKYAIGSSTTLKIIASIVSVTVGVLSLVFLHGYGFSYTIYILILLGCIAIASFLLCSCAVIGIFRHKKIEQTKIDTAVKWIYIFSAGIAILVFAPVIIIDFFAFHINPWVIFVSFLTVVSISVFLTIFGIVKCINTCRIPLLTDIVLYQGSTCPCRKTKCENHGNCVACIEKHRNRNKPTRCERLKAKTDR